MRNLTVSVHISEEEAKRVFQQALSGGEINLSTRVDKYKVSVVDLSDKVAIASITMAGREEEPIAFCFVDKWANPTDEVCSLCSGMGTTQTGISESPSTICERCDGHGLIKQ